MVGKGIKVNDFKEFLKFFYGIKLNLNLGNVEGVINSAKQLKVEQVFDLCEKFMIDKICAKKDQTFFAYHLASHNNANRLKTICEFEIAMNTEELLKLPSFLKLPHKTLQSFLQCNVFGCGEKIIFEALLRWAEAACKRMNKNPTVVKNLRNQLKELVYMIRFKSMKMSEFDACLEMWPGLFSTDEISEIRCIIGKVSKEFQTNFSKSIRFLKSQYKILECSRLSFFSNEPYKLQNVEQIIIKCSRLVYLWGFSCVCDREASISADVIIKAVWNQNQKRELFNQPMTLEFRKNVVHSSLYEASVAISKPLLLNPEYYHQIEIRFQKNPQSIRGGLQNNRKLQSFKDFEFGTWLSFHGTGRGMVSKISFTRVDNNIDSMGKEIYSLYSKIFVSVLNFHFFIYGALPSWIFGVIWIFTFGFYKANPQIKKRAGDMFMFVCFLILLTLIIIVFRQPILVLVFIIFWISVIRKKSNDPHH